MCLLVKSAGFQTPLSWSYTSPYFTISKWSALASGHGEQIRGTGRYTTEKEAALKNAVHTSFQPCGHKYSVPRLLQDEALFSAGEPGILGDDGQKTASVWA